MIIIDFLNALGHDIGSFFVYNPQNFFTSTLLLVIALVLVGFVKHFIFMR